MTRQENLHTSVVVAVCCLVVSCGSDDEDPVDPPQVNAVPVEVDAGTVTGALRPLWGDHYDLSYTHRRYADEAGFVQLVNSLEPRSIRCSVGRWEVGFPPPAGGDSLDPLVLQTVEREFYRGANDLASADVAGNYDFTYLDLQLTELLAQGFEIFLCFDYMPFTLSSEQDPMNAQNIGLNVPGTPFSQYSFSNGIRTAPPSDPAVYARVVRNVVRHVRGQFAGSTDFGVECIEIGNEPDITAQITGIGAPFYTGDRIQWIAAYQAIAAEIDGDAGISSLVQLGGGSFAFLDATQPGSFLEDVVTALDGAGTRFDYLSFHTYGDVVDNHLNRFVIAQTIMSNLGLNIPWVNGEWGRALDGDDPVYNQIEHGILRAKVLGLMQLFPFQYAHESIMRDVGPGGSQLGLLRTGPPAHKPASDCYRLLARMNGTLDALSVTAPTGTFVLAGRDAGSSEVFVVAIVDPPSNGTITRIELTLDSLPFGANNYSVERLRVTQGSSDSGVGVEVLGTSTMTGASLQVSVDVAAGEEGLYAWHVSEL